MLWLAVYIVQPPHHGYDKGNSEKTCTIILCYFNAVHDILGNFLKNNNFKDFMKTFSQNDPHKQEAWQHFCEINFLRQSKIRKKSQKLAMLIFLGIQ